MKTRTTSVDVARGALMLYIVFVVHGIFWLKLLPQSIQSISSIILFEMPCLFIVSGYSYFLYPESVTEILAAHTARFNADLK